MSKLAKHESAYLDSTKSLLYSKQASTKAETNGQTYGAYDIGVDIEPSFFNESVRKQEILEQMTENDGKKFQTGTALLRKCLDLENQEWRRQLCSILQEQSDNNKNITKQLQDIIAHRKLENSHTSDSTSSRNGWLSPERR